MDARARHGRGMRGNHHVSRRLSHRGLVQQRIHGTRPDHFGAADEIWITSATKEVMPVTRLDGQAVGTGKPGPIYKRIHGLYQDYKRTIMRRG